MYNHSKTTEYSFETKFKSEGWGILDTRDAHLSSQNCDELATLYDSCKGTWTATRPRPPLTLCLTEAETPKGYGGYEDGHEKVLLQGENQKVLARWKKTTLEAMHTICRNDKYDYNKIIYNRYTAFSLSCGFSTVIKGSAYHIDSTYLTAIYVPRGRCTVVRPSFSSIFDPNDPNDPSFFDCHPNNRFRDDFSRNIYEIPVGTTLILTGNARSRQVGAPNTSHGSPTTLSKTPGDRIFLTMAIR